MATFGITLCGVLLLMCVAFFFFSVVNALNGNWKRAGRLAHEGTACAFGALAMSLLLLAIKYWS